MALSDKITKAVKDAQKQAETAVTEVRGTIDKRIVDASVDPTPFYAIVGAADIAMGTVRTASEQLEASRAQASKLDLRKSAKKEAQVLQKDLQKRITELRNRTAELQKLAATYADRFVAQAQELPAQVLNQGLVLASNAKDEYEAAAARGEKVVTDLRATGEKTAAELADRSGAVVARGRNVAKTAVAETEKVAKTLRDVVSDDASTVTSQVEKSVKAVDEAAAPVPVEPSEATKAATRRLAARKAAATRKAHATEATTTRKVAARTAAAKKSATTTAKSTTAKSTTAKSTAKKAPAKKTPAKKTAN